VPSDVPGASPDVLLGSSWGAECGPGEDTHTHSPPWVEVESSHPPVFSELLRYSCSLTPALIKTLVLTQPSRTQNELHVLRH
jgi:hypothetical protein